VRLGAALPYQRRTRKTPALGSHSENADQSIRRKRDKVEEPLYQKTRESTSENGPFHFTH